MLQELYTFITQSFDDKQFSRNEANVLRQMLEERELDQHKLNLLRRHIYDLARQKLYDPRDTAIILWMEAILKTIDATITQQRDNHTEVLFFPSEVAFQRLLQMLDEVRQTIDICVFTITEDRIANTLVQLHQRGIAIRIISDDDKALDLGSDVNALAQKGISIRFDRSTNHMHHKFAILDNRLLLNGSFNWTRSAFLYNQENIVISDQPKLLHAFQQEFDKLWLKFQD